MVEGALEGQLERAASEDVGEIEEEVQCPPSASEMVSPDPASARAASSLAARYSSRADAIHSLPLRSAPSADRCIATGTLNPVATPTRLPPRR